MTGAMIGAFFRLLIDASIRASIAAFLVAGALRAHRVRSSAVRHSAWTALLFTMLFMPLLTYSLPAIGIRVAVPAPFLARTAAVESPSAFDQPGPGFFDRAEPRAGEPAAAEGRLREPLSMPANPPSPARSLPPAAPLAALVTYSVVALAMLIRCLAGWRGAARISSASRAVNPPSECLPSMASREKLDIRVSRVVAAPVTVGVLRPRILLPMTWSRWPNEKLGAVLAHEIAHVRRRDPLVAFVAELNRCLFWFHPLSWWLARQLAASAEEASDDEAMRAIGERAAYAEILVDLARAVRRRRGRILWPSVGLGGTGLLGQRVERALSGDLPSAVSPARKRVLGLSCAAAIVLAVACQPAPLHENVAIEQRDSTLRAELERMQRSSWKHFTNVDWDEGAEALETHEQALRVHPEDLQALQQFLMSYWVQYACRPVADCGNPLVRNKAVDRTLLSARRAHILWLIEHHPESDVAGFVEARIFPNDLLEPFFPGDPAGYARARALWLEQANRARVNAAVLGHAADFFETADKPLAEQMLLRARAIDPQGPWDARLGRLYAIALVGSLASAGRGSLRAVSVPEPRSSFGQAAREKLGASTDDVLLTAAGWFLEGAGSGRRGIDFDPQYWAESCFTRALEINPAGVLAHSALLGLRSQQRRNREPLWRVAPAALDTRVDSLPDAEKFRQLPELARGAYLALENISRWDDPNLRGRRDLAREQARRYAEDALRLAPKFRSDPGHGTAIYTANMTLAGLALRDSDRKRAVEYMRKASEAPASEDLAYSLFVVSDWNRVTRGLLAQGERQAVIDFLDRMAQTSIAERADLRKEADSLRRGDIPPELAGVVVTAPMTD